RVTLNETSDAALQRGASRAAEIAAALPADPEYVGPLPPQKYLDIKAFDDVTNKAGAVERLPGVRAVIEPAAKEGMNSSGFFENGATVQCVANSAGNFGYFRSTEAAYSATARTGEGGGSGWAQDSSYKFAEVEAPALAARPRQESRDSRHATQLGPGDYAVILEPGAGAEFLGFTLTGALSARAVEEGRSYFSKKGGGTLVGEKLFHESVT